MAVDGAHCTKCGYALAPYAKFCSECGAQTELQSAPVGIADVIPPIPTTDQRWDAKYKQYEAAMSELDYLDPGEPEWEKQWSRIDHLSDELDALMEAMEIEGDLDSAEADHEAEYLGDLGDELGEEDREKLQGLADAANSELETLREELAQIRKAVPYGTFTGPPPDGTQRSRLVCGRCMAGLFELKEGTNVASDQLRIVPCTNCGYTNETELRKREEEERIHNTMPDLDAVAAWVIEARYAGVSEWHELRLLSDGTLWEGPETGERMKSNYTLRCSDPSKFSRFTDRKFKTPLMVERFLADDYPEPPDRLVPPTPPVASWTYDFAWKFERKINEHRIRLCLYPDGGLFIISPTNDGHCINQRQDPLPTPEAAEQFILGLVEKRADVYPFFHTFVDLTRDSVTLNPADLPAWRYQQTPSPPAAQARDSASQVTTSSPQGESQKVEKIDPKPRPLSPQMEEQKLAVRQTANEDDAASGKLDDNVAFIVEFVLALAIIIFYVVSAITVIVPVGALLYLLVHQSK